MPAGGAPKPDGPAPLPPPPIGTTLNGRWRLDAAPLPDADPAGFSTLRRAVDLRAPDRVAVAKIESPEPGRAAGSRARLRQEHAILAAIDSPRVVAVHDAGDAVESGRFYMILDYYPRGSLARLLRHRGELRLGWALGAVAEVLGALDLLHQGLPRRVVHRDVNPRNLLVAGSGRDGPRLVLADFGLAHDLDAPGLEAPGADPARRNGERGPTPARPVFSPWYAPPELVRGDPPARAGVASDLYEASAVLYELVTGLPPYQREAMAGGARFEQLVLAPGTRPLPARWVNPAVPRVLEELLAGGLAHDPGERPACARDLLDPLRALARDHGSVPIPFATLRLDGLADTLYPTA